MSPKTEKGQVCVGRFSDPHGVKGGIRLKSLTARLETVKTFQTWFSADGEALNLSFSQKLKDGFVVALDGVTTPEDAKKWKGREVFVKRDQLKMLDDGEFYQADLVNLSVVTLDGVRIGAVTAINNFGAGDLIDIALDKAHKGVGKTLVIPFRDAVVTEVDLKKGTLTINPEGWLEDEK